MDADDRATRRLSVAGLDYKIVIEAFSVLSGAAFIVSGVCNAALFWLAWHLNYFVVASPGDVVMSSFYFVALIAVLSALLALATIAIRKAKWVPLRPSLRLVRLVSISSLVSLVAALASLMIAVFSAEHFKTDADLARESREAAQTTVEEITPEQAEQFEATIFPATNIGLATDLVLPRDSPHFAACGRAPVLWMGVSSVIISCRGRVRVLHNTQELALERLGT